jgi:hypothetical protein
MRNRNSIDILAILTASAAFAVIFLSSWEFGPPLDRKLPSEIGRVLAKEALSLLHPSGQITVITRDTEAFPQPTLDILLKSFEQEIRRGSDCHVGTQTIQLDPLRPVEVPPGDFYELIRRSNAERIIVSLLGPPVLTPAQRGALGRVQPKIIAFCSGNLAETLDLKELFNAGLLHVALINKPPSPGTAETRPNGARTFERLYTIVRTDASTLREPSRAAK